MSGLLTVELGGVRVREQRTLHPDAWYATFSVRPDVSQVEFVLFNQEDRGGELSHLTNTEPGDPTVVLYFTKVPSHPRECVEEHIRAFLSVRRMLKSPTQAEAVELLAHENAIVREYARTHWAEWRASKCLSR